MAMTDDHHLGYAGLLRRVLESVTDEVASSPDGNAEEDASGLSGNPTNLGEFVDDGGSSTSDESGFDPVVFWGVNGFLLLMLASMIVWCVCCKKEWLTNPDARRAQSDAAFRERIRRRQERYEKSKIESPEKRKQKLLDSFMRHGVTMVVTAEDLLLDNLQPECDKPTPAATNSGGDVEMGNGSNINNDQDAVDDKHNAGEDAEDGNDMDSSRDLSLADSINATGYLKLPAHTDRQPVPNCCAICLGEYDVGDHVVWSSNPSCSHCFHEDCIIEWLIKMQPATPCPCCRQEFTDLEALRKEKKIIWSGDAFNFNGIAL